MKRIIMVGLCLTSVLVMSAVAVATASATIVATPQFRFAEGSKDFSSTGGEGTLETTSGEKVVCLKETDSGEIEGASPSHRVGDLLISYKECSTTVLGVTKPCKSSGANAEEIKTFDLLGRLGWLEKAKERVGILFNPEKGISGNPNNLFAEFKCFKTSGEAAEVTVKVRGSVIALIEPVNVLIGPKEAKKSFRVTFEKEVPGKLVATDSHFEGEGVNKLETETTTSKKFIESAAAGTAEIFPLVSTLIEANTEL
jgi:hypothetical protein